MEEDTTPSTQDGDVAPPVVENSNAVVDESNVDENNGNANSESVIDSASAQVSSAVESVSDTGAKAVEFVSSTSTDSTLDRAIKSRRAIALKTVAPAVISGAIGACASLIFYPQFIFGLFFIGCGIFIKLITLRLGVLLFLLAFPVLLIAGVALDLSWFRVNIPSTIRLWAKSFAPQFWSLINMIPPWIVIIFAFALPAIGQVVGSHALLQALIAMGSSSSALTIFIFLITAVFVFVMNSLGVTWFNATRLTFMLQTFWVTYQLLLGSGLEGIRQADIPLLGFISSFFIGLGSFILSLAPEHALVDASKAALQSAIVSGGIAAGIGAGLSHVTDPDGDAMTVSEWTSAEVGVAKEWATNNLNEVYEGVSRAGIQETITNALEQLKKIISIIFSASRNGIGGLRALLAEDDEEIIRRTQPPPIVAQIVEQIVPPLPVAWIITAIGAFPTLFVVLLAIVGNLLSSVQSIGANQQHQQMNQYGYANAQAGRYGPHGPVNRRSLNFSAMLLLFPFILVEFATVARFLLMKQDIQKYIYSDGMSILLWKQPDLLKAWKHIKEADQNLREAHANLLGMILSPRRYLYPSEELVRSAPPLTEGLSRLAFSLTIDAIGMLTFAIPLLGEVADVFWAPASAYLIQRVYERPGFSLLAFAEELLPFTDIIPTATITWLFIYAIYIPSWVVRVRRTVLEPNSASQIAVDEGSHEKSD